MWIVFIAVLWTIAIFLLLAFLRGAALANESYDHGHEAAVLRASTAYSPLHKRAA
jgi:hypothetical protein